MPTSITILSPSVTAKDEEVAESYLLASEPVTGATVSSAL
jgi:hypothetical protein